MILQTIYLGGFSSEGLELLLLRLHSNGADLVEGDLRLVMLPSELKKKLRASS